MNSAPLASQSPFFRGSLFRSAQPEKQLIQHCRIRHPSIDRDDAASDLLSHAFLHLLELAALQAKKYARVTVAAFPTSKFGKTVASGRRQRSQAHLLTPHPKIL